MIPVSFWTGPGCWDKAMGKFVIRRLDSGFKFDLCAANGRAIASSEVYSAYAACRKGLESVAKCAGTAPVEDLTVPGCPCANPKFQLYADRSGAFRFRLRSRNGKIIAVSASYATKASCSAAIESVRQNALDAQSHIEDESK